MKIFKYSLALGDVQNVWMPEGAKLLSVQVQRETIVLWALVSPDAECVKRKIVCSGTGHNVIGVDAQDYIGTIQLLNGELVLHFFDGGEM